MQLHKSHVMLGAWASSALAWCYFQTSPVMPTPYFLAHCILNLELSAPVSPAKSPQRGKIKRRTSRISVEEQFGHLVTDAKLNLKSIFCTAEHSRAQRKGMIKRKLCKSESK